MDAIIRIRIDTLFSKYDKDGDGSLDKEETRKFFQDIKGLDFSQTEFDECFRIFDKDGRSKIEKKELEFFINIIAGL